MKYKGILLDIDNTLYDYEKAHRRALRAVFDLLKGKYALKKTVLARGFQRARSQVHKELAKTASSHNRILYFQRMLEQLRRNPLKDTLDCYNTYWDTFLQNLKFYHGIYDFLKFMENFKVCIVSDLTAQIQHRKIREMKLFDYAEFLVTSEEAGREKPHPRVFKLALRKLGLKPKEVCMIGDDYEKDILGAVKLGIRAFWLNRNGKQKKPTELVREFKSFVQLIRYLK